MIGIAPNPKWISSVTLNMFVMFVELETHVILA